METIGASLNRRACNLRSRCYSCRDCDLGKTGWSVPDARMEEENYDPHVFAVGNLASKIFFIAEAPGYEETIHRKPLVGRSGRLFDEIVLGGLGLLREDVWITNAVLCRPPNNRKPTQNELLTCSQHLEAQFELIKPKLVVVMGTTPMNALLGIPSGITKLAGTTMHSAKYDVEVFVLWHPSYVNRTGKYTEYKNHVSMLKNVIQPYL